MSRILSLLFTISIGVSALSCDDCLCSRQGSHNITCRIGYINTSYILHRISRFENEDTFRVMRKICLDIDSTSEELFFVVAQECYNSSYVNIATGYHFDTGNEKLDYIIMISLIPGFILFLVTTYKKKLLKNMERKPMFTESV